MPPKGQAMPESAKRKLSEYWTKYWAEHEHYRHTKEAKEKISQAQKGRKQTPIHRQHWREAREITGKGKKGKHPRWREEGSRRRHTKGGYVLIKASAHPRANRGWALEHIVIWEQANGRALPEGFVVHHFNGIKSDNRPKNLIAVPKKGHSPALAVKEVQRRLREVEAELAQQRML